MEVILIPALLALACLIGVLGIAVVRISIESEGITTAVVYAIFAASTLILISIMIFELV